MSTLRPDAIAGLRRLTARAADLVYCAGSIRLGSGRSVMNVSRPLFREDLGGVASKFRSTSVFRAPFRLTVLPKGR